MTALGHIQIGPRQIGDGQPVFIIAEIGYNFRSIQEAKASIDAAIGCGADAVKFQTFKAETLASKRANFPSEAGGVNQFEEFKQFEMSEEMHKEIFGHARSRRILTFSTPSYYDDVELLERLEVPAYKIGSDDLTNLPFLRFVASKNKPVILSTGMGTQEEVAEAVDCFRSLGNGKLVLLHCVSNYPVKSAEILNLRVIQTLRSTFGLPVGLSDHTTTPLAAWGAVALGACVIERHFTIDKKLPVPDAFFSADPNEMRTLVSGIRDMESALGDGVKRPTPTEEAMRQMTRKSIIARSFIRQGEVIREEQIIIKRPGHGISPDLSKQLIGRRAKRDIAFDEAITWDMV